MDRKKDALTIKMFHVWEFAIQSEWLDSRYVKKSHNKNGALSSLKFHENTFISTMINPFDGSYSVKKILSSALITVIIALRGPSSCKNTIGVLF